MECSSNSANAVVTSNSIGTLSFSLLILVVALFFRLLFLLPA